jgi:hypothetical protein
MSSIPRRKAKTVSVADPDAVWNIKTIGVLASVLVCFCLLFFWIESRVASLPKEFEGRIVEKHVDGSDTDQGSYRSYRVLVEIDGQPRLSVPVNRDIYEEAQVGMVLKRTEKGLEVVRGSGR